MNYRADIDGLRAISVIAVIIFHTGFSFLSGGFVGVDIFFVISGYLITGLVYKEISSGSFSYITFYKRRIARLLPALVITLLMVLLFGFLFYDTREFDSLGKELFFSSLGAANLLFAEGVDYFAQDDSVRPLIHLWSLGVEEQFYLVWPTLLVLLAFLKLRHILAVIAILFFISLYMAIVSVETAPIKTYFQPQYRAFELIIGAFTALAMTSDFYKKLALKKFQKEIIAYVALLLIVIPMFLLDQTTTFPGFNTLYPIVGTALLIAFTDQTKVSKFLSLTPLVFIGLISYPLYLYHQPILSYIHLFELTTNKLLILTLVLFISIVFAWLTYKFIEKPIRKAAHINNTAARFKLSSLVVSLVAIATVGMYIAKHDGIGARFKLLNPYSYEVIQNSFETFFEHYEPGVNIAENDNAKALFIGDSVLQHYVYPLSKRLKIEKEEIDSITRGGCVLLKGVDFKDIFSDIPCNDLNKEVYKLKKHYKYIVISQLWESYSNQVLNFPKVKDESTMDKWAPFIEATIKHFQPMADHIIIIGDHVHLAGIDKLRPTIFLSKDSYESHLSDLKVINSDKLIKSVPFFNQFQLRDNVTILHPIDIWLNKEGTFTLHDKKWSFFGDDLHASNASTGFIINKLKNFPIN